MNRKKTFEAVLSKVRGWAHLQCLGETTDKRREVREKLGRSNLHDDLVQTTTIITQISLSSLLASPPQMYTHTSMHTHAHTHEHMLSPSGNSLIVTPVMIIIVMSNISIAMLANIITRQQNWQTLRKIKPPNVWRWWYQPALHQTQSLSMCTYCSTDSSEA